MIRGQRGPAPDTVTEAVRFLAEQGYTEALSERTIAPPGLAGSGIDPLAGVTVDYTFRFEGESDPGDEAIVIGVRWSGSNRRGVFVSAFGPGADPGHAALLVALSGR